MLELVGFFLLLAALYVTWKVFVLVVKLVFLPVKLAFILVKLVLVVVGTLLLLALGLPLLFALAAGGITALGCRAPAFRLRNPKPGW
jgi:hypothetical protein